MKNIKVVFMGTPEFSVPVLEGLIENYNVIGVVTQPDKEVGRHKEIEFSPIKKVALANNIQVLQPVKIKEEYEEIVKLNPDIIVTCAYGQIIPKILLDLPKYKCINVHASLLPALRGGAPIHRAIINGHSKTGITIMYMDAKMDSGDIIRQKEVEIDSDMNVGVLHDKLSLLGRELLLETLPDIISGNISPVKQDESQVTFAKIIKREDELLDFNENTIDVYNKIRGLNPFPGAYTILDGKIVKIYKARIEKNLTRALPGEIVNLYKDGFAVKTFDGEIVIQELKIEGKKKMDSVSFMNGIGKENLLGKRMTKE
ncbi:MAG: methionyl-tRNA formyltransferase [Bacilli bacterium]|nr:methionyl-tRNA formyltransferase [Bacilli bacterium]